MKRRERYSIRSFFVMQGRKRRRIQRRIQRRRNTHAKSTGSRLLGGARRRRRRRSIQDVFWFRRSESHRVCGVCTLHKTELHCTALKTGWFLSVSSGT